MSFKAIESTALFERLAALPATAQGACVVLCASPRLAAGLQDAYGHWQARRGVSVWAAVPMMTAEVFVREQAQRAAAQQALVGQPTASVLSAAESDLLWRIVVSEARSEVPLLRESEAARQAAEAWKLCQAYGLRLPLDATTPDVERFNQWAQSYRERLRKLARIDAGDAWQLVLEQLAAATVKAPRLVILAGFEQLAPAVQSLLAALERAGGELLELQPAEHTAQSRGIAAASAEHELRAAAQWVRETALAQPQARIGVIVPDLGARRADLLRVFDEVLCPQRDVLDSSPRERPYNLSLGQSLAEIGVVAGALQILRLCTSGITLDQATALLCGPYWGDAADDVLARAAVDRQLRDEGEWQIGLQVLRKHAWRHPALGAQLERLSAASAQRDRADAGVWAERFSRTVYLLGGRKDEVEKAERNLRDSFRGLRLVGRHAGFYPKSQEKNVLLAIKKATPTFLLVGGGLPGRDLWVLRRKKELTPGIYLWVDDCFELFSGKKKSNRQPSGNLLGLATGLVFWVLVLFAKIGRR